MSIESTPGSGDAALEALTLRAFVRKLVAKGGLLTMCEGSLVEVAGQLTTVMDNDLTVEEARSIITGDIASFLAGGAPPLSPWCRRTTQQ